MTTILVVDDDLHVRKLIEVTMQQAGFQTIVADNGNEAWDKLGRTKIDLVILDIMMPVLDGWRLCQRIRQSQTLPIVMLTALAEVSQKVRGLGAGADDYITKPFEPPELVARVQTVLRRFRISTDQEIEIGNLHLDARTHQVRVNGADCLIAPKEFLLLFHLASYPGQTLLRERLIENVWGYDFAGDERTLDVHIKRLRDKFPPETAAVSIRTLRGLGYRMEVIP